MKSQGKMVSVPGAHAPKHRAGQEIACKSTNPDLHDEVTPTLVGIHVGLATFPCQ